MNLSLRIVTLSLAVILCHVGANTSSVSEVNITAPYLAAKVPGCSPQNDYCGIFHDRMFYQYRPCCAGSACVAYDFLDRKVTDVVSFLQLIAALAY
jgi:hypothetical protein